MNGLFAGCLTSQQHASVSQGWMIRVELGSKTFAENYNGKSQKRTTTVQYKLLCKLRRNFVQNITAMQGVIQQK